MSREAFDATAREKRAAEEEAWGKYRVALASGSPDTKELRAAWMVADKAATQAEYDRESYLREDD